MKSYREYASLSSLTRFKVTESREMRRKKNIWNLKSSRISLREPKEDQFSSVMSNSF